MAEAGRPSYPAATKYQGDVAARYVQRRDADPTWQWEDDHVRRYVASLPTDLEVLDVPVGTGRYVPIYLDAGWHVHGCDISADMIAVATEQLGARAADCDLVVAPAEALPLADRSVDVIVSGRFIQWIPTLPAVARVVEELARVGRDELFLQLRIPARAEHNPTGRGAARDAARALRRALKRRILQRNAAPAAAITAHPEPALLAILEQHGWELVSISEECPSDAGLRFYRFRASRSR